jgi:hypothetical protein
MQLGRPRFSVFLCRLPQIPRFDKLSADVTERGPAEWALFSFRANRSVH